MSTNASLKVKDENGEVIVNLYKHWDGDSFGRELADFIRGSKIVNGIGRDIDNKTYNGIGCFAASLVAHFKKEIGDVYLKPLTDNNGQQYDYVISVKDGELKLYS